MEQLYDAINKGVQKALTISDDQENDVSVKWYEKENSADVNMINFLVNDFKENDDNEHYMNIISYHNEHPNRYYIVKDIHELINIYYKIWMSSNTYDRATGITHRSIINLQWINTENALTFIRDDRSEITLSEYEKGDNSVEFIKFKNIKGCDHPIIIHKNLFIDKWLSWNDKMVNSKKFNNKDCITDYEGLKKDFNGYEHTYNNANIGNYSYHEAGLINLYYQNYPALKYAASLNNLEKFDGYISYLPAIGELVFLGNCYYKMFLNYILQYIGSKKNIELYKDLWWSSTEVSFGLVAVIKDNPDIPAQWYKAEHKKYAQNFKAGHVIPMFKEL